MLISPMAHEFNLILGSCLFSFERAAPLNVQLSLSTDGGGRLRRRTHGA